MFREMRRKKQMLSAAECADLLSRGSSGVLALAGDGGYPYAVPISYVYDGEKLYFHCASSGHKLDAIRRNPKASFCVIGQDRILPEAYTTAYQSVIVFGAVRILEDDGEKRTAIEKLALKYAPEDTKEHRHLAIERDWNGLCMLELTPEHISGKEGIELVKERASEKA